MMQMILSVSCLSLLAGVVMSMPGFDRNFGMMEPGFGGPGGFGGGLSDPYSPFGNPMSPQPRPTLGARNDNPYPFSPQQYNNYNQFNPSNQGFGFGSEGRNMGYGGYNSLRQQPEYGAMYDPNQRQGATFGGASGFMGSLGGDGGGFMGGEGEQGMGGDGMEDMFRMQAEMQQMQKQLAKGPQKQADSKAPNTKVTKVGENIVVTNQTRFADNNDGLTQGFFQEFHIYPGMETTTTGSNSGADLARSAVAGDSSASTSIPSLDSNSSPGLLTPAGAIPKFAATNAAVIPAEAIFGFAAPNTFPDPRKLGDLPPASASPNKLPSRPKKASFASQKFEALAAWNFKD